MNLIQLAVDRPIWDRFFLVAPLVIIGSKEPDGTYDLAPKHMAIPLGWQNYYAFVCSSRHATYHNIRRERHFTVSFPRPSDVVTSSLAASPRCDDDTKPTLRLLGQHKAAKVDGVLVDDCYLYLECTLHSVMDGFGVNSLIVGEVIAASADETFLRAEDRDEAEQLFHSPLLVYVSPGRYGVLGHTTRFPFPEGYSR
ncbi:MAG TPA: flavin reductase [Vicinamibacterales bacterium]|nr:flavin reductase [Vicinamibacterales bacterium]